MSGLCLVRQLERRESVLQDVRKGDQAALRRSHPPDLLDRRLVAQARDAEDELEWLMSVLFVVELHLV